MTTADQAFVSRALGTGALRAALDGRVGDLLALLMAEHPDLMETQQGHTFALGLGMRVHSTRHGDMYIPSGRIGNLDLNNGVYTAYEVFQLAARDIAGRGLAVEVAALLRAGRQTVRDFLTERYGVFTGPRQYWTPTGRMPNEADVRDFLRVLRRAQGVATRN